MNTSVYRTRLADALSISRKLEEVMVALEDGRSSYRPGWSDHIVALALGLPFLSDVVRVRRELYGKLVAHHPQEPRLNPPDHDEGLGL